MLVGSGVAELVEVGVRVLVGSGVTEFVEVGIGVLVGVGIVGVTLGDGGVEFD